MADIASFVEQMNVVDFSLVDSINLSDISLTEAIILPQAEFVESLEVVRVPDHTMTRRIHSLSNDPHFDADIEYVR
jgi:hypothetical protein